MSGATNGWDDVWADYDARTGRAPRPAAATHWYMEPDYADTAEQAAPPSRGGRPLGMMALASLAVVMLVMMLNLRFAPDPAQRLAGNPAPRALPVLSIASPAEASTSPTPALPIQAVALPEPMFGELLAVPPPSWVRPEAIRAAALAAPVPSAAGKAAARRESQRRHAAVACAPLRARAMPGVVRLSAAEPGLTAAPMGALNPVALAVAAPRGPPRA
jgi:hypothetical protein